MEDRPTQRQLEYIWSLAVRASIPAPEVATKAEASDMIKKLSMLVPRLGPTAAQRELLERLRYDGPWPSSRTEASEIIQRLLRAREERGRRLLARAREHAR